ncbi:MAG: DUF2851 family protein, partial [Bacteroidetes bacterium]|nr:DUF2851 family protein [Bacteroidota bacterium]
LFGQAGMLENEDINDTYYQVLQKEYRHLRRKFSLRPIESHLWKYLRLRPSGFPQVRVAQFAVLIHKTHGFFSKIIDSQNVEDLADLFDLKASSYWDTRYVFGRESHKISKKLGDSAFNAILINTIVPIVFIYGKVRDIEEYRRKAFRFLEQLPPEKNSIVSKWKKLGIVPQNAFESQALLQLKNRYCVKKKCLDCRIGNKLINL